MDICWVIFMGLYCQGKGFCVSRVDEGELKFFSFVVKKYSDQNIEDVKYFCDLVEQDVILVRLDVEIVGVGIGVCGLVVRDDLKVQIKVFDFMFMLERIQCDVLCDMLVICIKIVKMRLNNYVVFVRRYFNVKCLSDLLILRFWILFILSVRFFCFVKVFYSVFLLLYNI